MSELKAIQGVINGQQFELYLKSEADKVIALLKDKATYNECAYILKSEELANTCIFYEEELRHQKYKRCLTMARWADSEMNYWYDRIEMEQCPRFKFYDKWSQSWLELAEKFKPNNKE